MPPNKQTDYTIADMSRQIIFSTLFVLFFGCINIEAGIVDVLKKAENKGPVHSISGVDYIYMINLDERPEKFCLASAELKRYGIIPYRFSAINGRKLSVDQINQCGVKFQPGMTPLAATTFREEANGMPSNEWMVDYGRAYFRKGIRLGAIGCALSHLSVLKDALDSGYEVIWVLEDDIEVVEEPAIITDLMQELDRLVGSHNWDVLFTDVDYREAEGVYRKAYGAPKRPDLNCSSEYLYARRFTQDYRISDSLRRISARFGTHSMIIKRSGMKKLYRYAVRHGIFQGYDLENYLPSGIKRYAPTFDIVTNMLDSISDIGGS